jgi:S1-C subfamily serine protease
LNLVDLGIALFVLALGAIGAARGLVASVLPLIGFVGGAALGARIGPELLEGGSQSQYAPLVAVAIGILAGSVLAIALDGVAHAIRPQTGRGGILAFVDGAGGAVVLGALGVLLAWAFGAVALHTTGEQGREVRESVQRSTILAALNDLMPPSGPLLNVLRRVDPRPVVRGPDADVAAPDEAILEDPEVAAASASAVRVLGTACGLGVAGSGWVAAAGLVVTNAHVVAGEEDTTVRTSDGPELDAVVVHYDTRNDLAVLRAPGLGAEPLAVAGRAAKGAPAAVIGYPANGPLSVEAARLGRTGTVISQDSYGRGPVRRKMTPFRGQVRSGNSGGPVVGSDGAVLTTVFAASQGEASGLGVPNGVLSRALSGPLEPTDTGPCAA